MSEPESPPPVLGSWNQLYGLVLTVLVVQVIAYYLLTRMFS